MKTSFPTPQDLRISHEKSQQPDLVLLERARQKIASDIEGGYPLSRGLRYSCRSPSWLKSDMTAILVAELREAGWDAKEYHELNLDYGITIDMPKSIVEKGTIQTVKTSEGSFYIYKG